MPGGLATDECDGYFALDSIYVDEGLSFNPMICSFVENVVDFDVHRVNIRRNLSSTCKGNYYECSVSGSILRNNYPHHELSSSRRSSGMYRSGPMGKSCSQ